MADSSKMNGSSSSASSSSQKSPSAPSSPCTPLSLFSSESASKAARTLYLKIFLGGTFMVILMVWTILPIYWGALWKIPARNLDGWVVDFDGGLIGERVSQALTSPEVTAQSRITWYIRSAEDFPGGPEALASAVKEEKTWAIIAVMPLASQNLTSSLATPNPTYDASRAIIAYAVEARNENAFRSLVRPSIDTALGSITRRIAFEVSETLTGGSDDGDAQTGTDAQIARVLRTSPQTLLAPVGYTLDNLVPFDQPVATAATFVGMLYQLIMSFFVVMISLAAREASTYSSNLPLKPLITLRIASSLFAYGLISLFYCLLNLAFHLDVGRVYGGSGGGFMVFWMVNWIGTLAVGMALESMITLLTPKGIPFFMLLWIISNLSVCIFPLQVLPGVFKYGYAMPFYNLSRALRVIVFGGRNCVGEVVGILIAWVVVSCITLSFFQWFVRRKMAPPGITSVEAGKSGEQVEKSKPASMDSLSVHSRSEKTENGTAPHLHANPNVEVDAVDAAVLDIDGGKA